MKVNSYTIIHYGRDYLPAALRSVHDFVEQSFIFFTPHPSHGHSTDLPSVESRQQIMDSIPSDLWKKITWVDVDKFWQEGQHRDYALEVASKNADLVLVLDYDEIWSRQTLSAALHHVYRANSAKRWLVNMAHFWRSFNWVCRDNNWPERIIDTRQNTGLAYVPKEFGDIYHFGYATTSELMLYKWSIHGHKDELRPTWFRDKWAAWPPPTDCHPTNSEGWWNPEPFDRWQLPEVLHSHPFFNVERIE